MKKLLVFLCSSLVILSIAREATCEYFYAIEPRLNYDSTNFYKINLVNLGFTKIGIIDGKISDLAYSPDGTLYGYDTLDEHDGYDKIVTVDSSTGNSTFITNVIDWSGVGVGIAFGPDGTLYASDHGDLVTIDLNTGQATLVGTNPGTEYDVDGLEFSSSGILYGINGAGSPYALYTFDLNNGINVPGTSYDYPRNIQSLAIDPNGVLFGIDNGVSRDLGDEYLVTINPSTGNTTEIGKIRDGFYGGLVYGGADPISHPSKAMPSIPLLLLDE